MIFDWTYPRILLAEWFFEPWRLSATSGPTSDLWTYPWPLKLPTTSKHTRDIWTNSLPLNLTTTFELIHYLWTYPWPLNLPTTTHERRTHPGVVRLCICVDGISEVADLDEHDLVGVVPPVIGYVDRRIVGALAVEERRLVHHHDHVARRLAYRRCSCKGSMRWTDDYAILLLYGKNPVQLLVNKELFH